MKKKLQGIWWYNKCYDIKHAGFWRTSKPGVVYIIAQYYDLIFASSSSEEAGRSNRGGTLSVYFVLCCCLVWTLTFPSLAGEQICEGRLTHLVPVSDRLPRFPRSLPAHIASRVRWPINVLIPDPVLRSRSGDIFSKAHHLNLRYNWYNWICFRFAKSTGRHSHFLAYDLLPEIDETWVLVCKCLHISLYTF